MADLSVTMTGIDELSRKLEGLKYDVARKGGRSALRKAAQVIRDQARSNAQSIDDPKSRDDITKNLSERWGSKFNKTTGDLMFRVGVLGGAGGNMSRKQQENGLPGGDTRHWRFVEFGTEKMPARPFMRPAMEQSAQRATDVFVSQYSAAIDRALKKAGG
jgi:HK97 gp10 family phage protein